MNRLLLLLMALTSNIFSADNGENSQQDFEKMIRLKPVLFKLKGNDQKTYSFQEGDGLLPEKKETPVGLFIKLIKHLDPVIKKEAWEHLEQQCELANGRISVEMVTKIANMYNSK